jgi:hypothetical protein
MGPALPMSATNQRISRASTSRHFHQSASPSSRLPAGASPATIAAASRSSWRKASEIPFAPAGSLKWPASPTSTHPGPADSPKNIGNDVMAAPPPTAPRGPVRPRRIRPGHRRPVRRAPPALRRGSRSAPGRPRPPLLDQGVSSTGRRTHRDGPASVGNVGQGADTATCSNVPSNPSNHGAPDVSTRSSTPSRSRQETPSAWIQWVDGVSEGNRARSPTTTDRPAVGGAWPTTSPRTGRPPR